MAKNVKLTNYHIRSIQAKVKHPIILLQHGLKKLRYCQKVGENNADVLSFDP